MFFLNYLFGVTAANDGTDFGFSHAYVIEQRTVSGTSETARAAYDALSCKCFARVDMVLDNDGEVYVRRVRGIPGLDRQSIFTRLVTESAYSYEEMLRMLIGAVVDLD